MNLFQGVTQPGGATGAVDRALGGAISDLIAAGDFTGATGETAVLYTRGAIPAARVLIVGLGEAASFGATAARNASATATRKARELGVKTTATIVHGAGIGGMEPDLAADLLVEGARLGLYRFAGYRSAPPQGWKPDPETLIIVEMDAARLEPLRRGIGARRGGRARRGAGPRHGKPTRQLHDADDHGEGCDATRRRYRFARRGIGS